MSLPPILYDLVRLALGPVLPVPRGIDRVDLGYAEYFFRTWPGEAFGVLPLPPGMPGGAFILERRAALRLVDHVARVWGETGRVEDDAAWRFVQQRLADPQSDFLQPAPPHHFRPHRILAALTRIFGPGIHLQGAIPHGAVYVNTGQLGLGFDWLTAWLKRRPDIRRVHMLHDVIPLDFPELVPRHGRDLHAAMVARTAREADGLIVTTEFVRNSVLGAMAAHGGDDMPVLAAPLPVPEPFAGVCGGLPASPQRYFVILGSIEPRKNHALLLKVWERFKDGQGSPKLVVAGTPWRDIEGIGRAVHASSHLRRNVVLVSGLTSPALCRLLAGAEALLQPSLVEGFGLPIVEALAQGTPVIASDQPAHREAGGAFVTYLPADDAAAWAAAIQAPQGRVTGYRAWDWEGYGGRLAPFLAQVAVQPKRA